MRPSAATARQALTRVLGGTGTGTFSTVRVATHKDTGMQYAVKAINLTDIQPQTLIRLRREIQVLPRAGLVLGAQPSTTLCCLSTFCAAGCARARSVLPASSLAGGF